VPPHQGVPVVFRRLIVGGADANIRGRRLFLDGTLLFRREQVGRQNANFQIRAPLLEPVACQFGLQPADGAGRE